MRPAPTLVNVRSSPLLPTETVPTGVVPANCFNIPFICIVEVEIAVADSLLLPRFTLLAAVVLTLFPNTKVLFVDTSLLLPMT